MRIGRLSIRNFIKDGLRKRLVRDLRKRRITSEADLQSCTYFHLRRYLSRDPKWTVLNRAYVRDTSVFPDLILRRRGRTRMVIELKEKRTLNSGWFRADTAKLQALWRRGSRPVIGFVICLLRQKESEAALQRLAESWRTPQQRKHIFPIVINARFHIKEWNAFKDWWKRNSRTSVR